MPKPHKIRALYVSPNEQNAREPWILGQPGVRDQVDFDAVYCTHSGSIRRFIAALFLPRRLAHYDLIVTAEYFEAAGINLRLLLTFNRARHLTWGLNQSRKLLTHWLVKPVADWMFRRTDAIVVHSNREIELFLSLHGLRRERFNFVHWGFDSPSVDATVFSDGRSPYVCLVGRNNRDLLTFAKGLEGTGVHGVVIADDIPENIRETLRAGGIEFLLKVDFNTCLDCIRNAMASAVLLNDSTRGAGHITMVSAMFLGVPQIVTNASVVADYFTDTEHGISVPLGDADAFRQAVIALRDDAEARQRMGANARRYAAAHFTNEAVASRFLAIVQGLENSPR